MIYMKDGKVVTKIEWTPPTEREDGSTYGDTDHAGYELGTSNPDDPNDGFIPYVSVPAAYNITSWPLNQLNLVDEGTYEVALRTVDRGGRVSVWSNPLVYSVTLANPNAPVGLTAS